MNKIVVAVHVSISTIIDYLQSNFTAELLSSPAVSASPFHCPPRFHSGKSYNLSVFIKTTVVRDDTDLPAFKTEKTGKVFSTNEPCVRLDILLAGYQANCYTKERLGAYLNVALRFFPLVYRHALPFLVQHLTELPNARKRIFDKVSPTKTT